MRRVGNIIDYGLVVVAVLMAALIEASIGRYIGTRALYFAVIIYFSLFGNIASGLLAVTLSGIAIYFTLLIPLPKTPNSIETVSFVLEGLTFVALIWQSKKNKKAEQEIFAKAERLKKSISWLGEINKK